MILVYNHNESLSTVVQVRLPRVNVQVCVLIHRGKIPLCDVMLF